METVTETLKAGDSVNFTGFGKFSPSARAARQGVNPRTGERVADRGHDRAEVHRRAAS